MRVKRLFLPKHLARQAIVFYLASPLGFDLAAAELPLPALQAQIKALAEADGFTVRALHTLGNDPGKLVSGPTREQLAVLLADFNHVLLADDSGAITSLIIISRIVAQPPRLRPRPRDIEIETTRRGPHHIVETTLVGPTGDAKTLSLMVDTGASTIVLPRAMSGTLGFNEEQLREGWSQTANGRVRTRQGVLLMAKVGRAEVRDVKVNFLDDGRLGNNALLGMSFLSHFKVTIDDENSRLILKKR